MNRNNLNRTSRPRTRVRYFVPNLRNNGPRNLRIRPVPRRNPRNVRTTIVQVPRRPRKNKSRQNPNRISSPYFNSTMTSGSVIRPIGPNAYHVEYVASIENFGSDSHNMVLPVHPLFMNKRILNMAMGFTNYDIKNIVMTTSPLVAVTDSSPITFAYTRDCIPVDYNTGSDTCYTALINMGVRGIAHTPLRLVVPNVQSLVKRPMCPVVPSDILCTIYGVSKQGSTTALENAVSISVACDLTFFNPYAGDEMQSNEPEQLEFITSNLGIRCNVAASPGFGFVVDSGISVCDCGELISFPKFTAVGIDYLVTMDHNNNTLFPVATATDRGTMHVNSFQLN